MSTLFNHFLKAIKPTLQQAGFSQSDSNFSYLVADNWVLINFQRSSSSTAITPHFTINLGVYSSVLATVFTSFRMRSNPASNPLEIDGHWRVRIGDLLPTPRDLWWQFTTDTIEPCRKEVQTYLTELVIPALQHYSSDMALRELWTTGSCLGISSERVRLEYLALLAKLYGTEDEVDTWLEILQRTSGNRTMQVMKRALEQI